MIQERILELTEYGLVTELVEPQDKRFTMTCCWSCFTLTNWKGMELWLGVDGSARR